MILYIWGWMWMTRCLNGKQIWSPQLPTFCWVISKGYKPCPTLKGQIGKGKSNKYGKEDSRGSSSKKWNAAAASTCVSTRWSKCTIFDIWIHFRSLLSLAPLEDPLWDGSQIWNVSWHIFYDHPPSLMPDGRKKRLENIIRMEENTFLNDSCLLEQIPKWLVTR